LRKALKIFSTSQAIDRLDFCRGITPPTTGNRKKRSCSPLSMASLYDKIGYTTAAVGVGLCGATRPTPPTSSKKQEIGCRNLTVECGIIILCAVAVFIGGE
jgi:hypothetical protein